MEQEQFEDFFSYFTSDFTVYYLQFYNGNNKWMAGI